MKIQVESSRLTKACSLANKNIPSKTTLPIIRNILVTAEYGMLHISSTDTESWVVYDVPAEVLFDGELRSFCIDATNITNILHAIPSQPITISLQTREGSMPKYYYAKIQHSCGTSELPVEMAEEFPVVKPITSEGHCVSAEALYKSIRTCRFALYNDAEGKPSMAALCIHFKKNSMVAVATDGNRIARLEHPDMGEESCQYLIPKKTISLLVPALEEVIKDKEAIDMVMFRKDDNNVCIQTATTVIYFRQITQRYPNYDSVIPKRELAQFQAVINRSDLLSAINRTSIMANAESMKLTFKFDVDKDLVVWGECIDFNTRAEEKIKCEFTGSRFLLIAFKATLLKEILSNMESEEVRFLMIDQTRQVVIVEENGNTNLLMLLMPMMLDI